VIGRIRALENAGAGAFYDTVDDRTTLGSDWTVLSGTALIINNDYVMPPNGQTLVFRRASEFATDKHYFQFRLRILGTNMIRVGIMSTATGSAFAGVEITTGTWFDSLQMISGTSPTTVTARNTTGGGSYSPSNGWRPDDIIGIGYDPDTLRYQAYRNDVMVAHWTDDTTVVPVGSGHRYPLVVINARPDFNRSGLDNFAGYDW
jgi:hypothetical protein